MSFIQRNLEKRIQKKVGENKVVLLYGTRRVGKTKLIQAIYESHKKKSLLLNGEDFDVQEMFLRRTVANYKRLLGNKQLLFIDEAQAIKDIGKVLKLMIDSFPKLTIIATGSSSFDLMNKSGEPLTGRGYQYTLYPVSNDEIIKHSNALSGKQQLEERLVYGSYPEVVTLQSVEEKQEYLKTIIQQYLLKDIFIYETVKNANKIYDLLKLLAYQTGNEVSLDELGRTLGISKNTVERYLDLLTKVFVIFKLGGYSSNLRKEVVKSSKWYFFDNGIRNAIISDFRDIALRNDKGQLWESYCIYERMKKQHYAGKNCEYYFWRTYDQQEIDLIEIENTKMRAYEFKWGKTNIVKPPKFFSTNYPKASFEVITKENYEALF
jgi:predicted AAA+ superfamily ATPase